LPSEVGDMTLPEALELFDYWETSPPEHEMLSMLAQAYTTWEPKRQPRTEEEAIAAHRKSLEERWRAGAMNVAQMFKSMGSKIIVPG
jgi:hypothetical protein